MSDIDPYQPPEANLEAVSDGGLLNHTQPMVLFLGQTQPWVRLMSVLLFIGAGFMVLGGAAMLIVGVVGAIAGGLGDGFSGATGIGMGAMYLIMAFMYLPPGLYLHRYANACGEVKNGAGASSIESALLHQKAFWRFIGIMAIVLMVAWPVFMIIVGLVAFLSASGS